MLRHFQIPYLEQEGYVNMRCAWQLGCPNEIKPLAEEGEHRAEVHAGGDYKQAFQVLFPGKAVPEYVGVSCCAQFAVTKEKIRERPKSDYERYRKWLLETDLKDSISGRIMEYSWHSTLPSAHRDGSHLWASVCRTPTKICSLSRYKRRLWFATWPHLSGWDGTRCGVGHLVTVASFTIDSAALRLITC